MALRVIGTDLKKRLACGDRTLTGGASFRVRSLSLRGSKPFEVPRTVKILMQLPDGSISGVRLIAPRSALCHLESPLDVQPPETGECFLCPGGFSLDDSALRTPLPLVSVRTRRTGLASTNIPPLPSAPISLRMRLDSDCAPATSRASVQQPSLRVGTIRSTLCRDHAEDNGIDAGIPIPPRSRSWPSAPSSRRRDDL